MLPRLMLVFLDHEKASSHFVCTSRCGAHDRLRHEADHLHLSINLVGYPGVQRKQRDTSLDRLRQPKLTRTGLRSTLWGIV